jgi:hypothetical protein
MVQSGTVQVETALFFETVEQIYQRVFRTLKPRTPAPQVIVRFRKYANANSRIKFEEGRLEVHIYAPRSSKHRFRSPSRRDILGRPTE